MRRTDWVAWHRVYEDPASRFSVRLRLVQDHLREVLNRQPPGPIRVVVPCAGQGRDLLGALVDHPRRGDVVATLIEFDLQNVEIARATARQLDLLGVTVVPGDAGRAKTYVGAVPASVIVLVGFLSYLSEREVARLVHSLPRLCAPGAIVVWARNAQAQENSCRFIRERFARADFTEVATAVESTHELHIGVERFDGTPKPLRSNMRLFSFRDPAKPTLTFRRVRRAIAWRARRLVHSVRGTRS